MGQTILASPLPCLIVWSDIRGLLDIVELSEQLRNDKIDELLKQLDL